MFRGILILRGGGDENVGNATGTQGSIMAALNPVEAVGASR
jgi:hypothetical protein